MWRELRNFGDVLLCAMSTNLRSHVDHHVDHHSVRQFAIEEFARSRGSKALHRSVQSMN